MIDFLNNLFLTEVQYGGNTFLLGFFMTSMTLVFLFSIGLTIIIWNLITNWHKKHKGEVKNTLKNYVSVEIHEFNKFVKKL